MISLICQKTDGGTISYDKNAIKLFVDSNDFKTESNDWKAVPIEKKVSIKRRPKSCNVSSFKDDEKPKQSNCSNSLGRPLTSIVTNLTNKHSEQRISAKKLEQVQEWLNEQIIKKSENANYGEKEKRFINLQHQFNKTITDENLIMKELKSKLNNVDTAQLRKREITYKNWRINVQEPIRHEINKVIDLPSAIDAKVVRDINYISYLKHLNKYGHAFQNDFDPKEYNPLERISLSAKVSSGISTNINQRRLINEHKILDKFALKNSMPLLSNDVQSRSEISWDKWLFQKYNAVESKIKIKSSRKCNPLRNNSKINFNWNYGNNFYHLKNNNENNNPENCLETNVDNM